MSKNNHFLSILLAGSLLCLTACGKPADFTDSLFADTENLFAEDAEAENIPLGSIVHWSDSKTLSYTGGILELPYHVVGSGLGAACGFLLFLDGIPQPYRMERDDSCDWLHRLGLTDNVQKDFSFYLEPVTGKAGETLTLTILSLSPQAFNSSEELPLGTSQNFLENYVSLAFEADAAPTQPVASTQPVADSGAPFLRSLSVSDEELTPETMDRYLSDGTGTSGTSVSELGTQVFQNCSLAEDGTEFTHVLLGHPDVRYRTTLFLDYIPLRYEDSCCVDRDLKSGLASRLDIRFDPGTLDGAHSFTVLSVPRNASDFPDDVLITETWSAILGDTQ